MRTRTSGGVGGAGVSPAPTQFCLEVWRGAETCQGLWVEVTEGVTAVNPATRRGRIQIGECDPSLIRFAGLAVTGELARRLRLVELINAELSVERRAAPVKVRRRGASPGELVVCVAECQLVGGECFSDLERVRADHAGAGLRAALTPSAPAALQRAKDFRRVHCLRVERALARCGEHLDRALGRDPGEPVRFDLDATGIEVYGRKGGAARSRHGSLSYAPHIAFWAQRGRALTAELVAGNREKLEGKDCARIAKRAIRLLPEGHGPATLRIDSAYYQLELLRALLASRRGSPCRCRAQMRCGRRWPRSPSAPSRTRST